MTDDIVTRLRESHEQSAKYPRLLLSEIEALTKAADEIERLRGLLYRWENCEQVIDALCGWDSEKTLCAECKDVKND